MVKNKLYYTVGLPRSGKSTYCDKWVEKKPKRVIVSPDDIRLALHGQAFIPEAENMVWTITKYEVMSLLKRGHDVIVDATNYNWGMRKQWYKMWPKIVDVPVITRPEKCLERAINTGKPELLEIIIGMFESWDYGHLPVNPFDDGNGRYISKVEERQGQKLLKAGYDLDKEEMIDRCRLFIDEYNKANPFGDEDVEVEIEFEE